MKILAGIVVVVLALIMLYCVCIQVYDDYKADIKFALKNPTNIFVLSSVIPSVMLILAMFSRLPYSYYVLLRWVVCVCWFIQAANCFFFILPGLGVSILFNPISPFRFTYNQWVILDLVALVFFLIGFCNIKNNKGV